MDEEVRALVVGRDEPEPLVVVEPLHGAGRHCSRVSAEISPGTPPGRAAEKYQCQPRQWRLTCSHLVSLSRLSASTVSLPGPQSITSRAPSRASIVSFPDPDSTESLPFPGSMRSRPPPEEISSSPAP